MLKTALFLTLALGIQSAAAVCPGEYTESASGACYLSCSQPIISRSDASSFCAANNNGQLVSIQTDAKLREIVSMLKAYDEALDGYMINAIFDASENVWKMGDGSVYDLNQDPRRWPYQLRNEPFSQATVVDAEHFVLSLMTKVQSSPNYKLYEIDLSSTSNIGALCEIEN